MNLSKQVKTALDETRLLMLGAQVLFGFQLNGVFQEEFANLSLASRYVDCAGQVLMVMAIGLLVAPSMQHRIVENGEDTVRIHRITGVFAGMALLPFAVSLGLGFYIVFDHVFGMTAALVAGSAFCLLAGAFWYGLGFSLRPKRRERTNDETNAAICTLVPAGKDAPHVLPQSMASGLLVTRPVLAPDLVTVTVKFLSKIRPMRFKSTESRASREKNFLFTRS